MIGGGDEALNCANELRGDGVTLDGTHCYRLVFGEHDEEALPGELGAEETGPDRPAQARAGRVRPGGKPKNNIISIRSLPNRWELALIIVRSLNLNPKIMSYVDIRRLSFD